MPPVSEILTGASLIVKLGLAVWDAVQSGDKSRTVGEIFDGVTKDEAEIDRLERERFPGSA